MEGCAECNEATCLSCKSDFYMDADGNCQKCSDSINYCTECKDGTFCDKCDHNIALEDIIYGNCVCNNYVNWHAKDLENQDQCVCAGFVNAETNECKVCEEQIPNCLECESISEYHETYTKVGITPLAPDQLDYVRCNKCKAGYYFVDEVKSCQACSSTLG